MEQIHDRNQPITTKTHLLPSKHVYIRPESLLAKLTQCTTRHITIQVPGQKRLKTTSYNNQHTTNTHNNNNNTDTIHDDNTDTTMQPSSSNDGSHTVDQLIESQLPDVAPQHSQHGANKLSHYLLKDNSESNSVAPSNHSISIRHHTAVDCKQHMPSAPHMHLSHTHTRINSNSTPLQSNNHTTTQVRQCEWEPYRSGLYYIECNQRFIYIDRIKQQLGTKYNVNKLKLIDRVFHVDIQFRHDRDNQQYRITIHDRLYNYIYINSISKSVECNTVHHPYYFTCTIHKSHSSVITIISLYNDMTNKYLSCTDTGRLTCKSSQCTKNCKFNLIEHTEPHSITTSIKLPHIDHTVSTPPPQLKPVIAVPALIDLQCDVNRQHALMIQQYNQLINDSIQYKPIQLPRIQSIDIVSRINLHQLLHYVSPLCWSNIEELPSRTVQLNGMIDWLEQRSITDLTHDVNFDTSMECSSSSIVPVDVWSRLQQKLTVIDELDNLLIIKPLTCTSNSQSINNNNVISQQQPITTTTHTQTIINEMLSTSKWFV